MTVILAVDPGPTTSGMVLLTTAGDPARPPRVRLSDAAVEPAAVCSAVACYRPDVVVVEWLTTYGAAVGASVLDTARIVGRIEESAYREGASVELIIRPEVCLELCQSRRAKKAEVRAACLACYPPTGGGKVPQVGTKGSPGPLYGVKSHAWDALAVGIAWWRGQ